MNREGTDRQTDWDRALYRWVKTESHPSGSSSFLPSTSSSTSFTTVMDLMIHIQHNTASCFLFRGKDSADPPGESSRLQQHYYPLRAAAGGNSPTEEYNSILPSTFNTLNLIHPRLTILTDCWVYNICPIISKDIIIDFSLKGQSGKIPIFEMTDRNLDFEVRPIFL